MADEEMEGKQMAESYMTLVVSLTFPKISVRLPDPVVWRGAMQDYYLS